jgi:hypothetical protein
VRWLLLGLAACGFRGQAIVDASVTADAIDAAPDANRLGDGLIAWYPLDGPPPAIDLVTGAANAPCAPAQMSCPTLAPGKIGMAYQFDGMKNWLEISPGAALQPAQLTVAFWAQWKQFPKMGMYQCPIGKVVTSSIANDNSWQLCVQTTGPATEAWLDISEHTTPPPDSIYAPAAIVVGTWYHIALTFDGTTKALYLDGALVASSHPVGPIAYDTGKITIGADILTNDSIDVPFNGLLDEIRIYDRALSQGELMSLAQ